MSDVIHLHQQTEEQEDYTEREDRLAFMLDLACASSDLPCLYIIPQLASALSEVMAQATGRVHDSELLQSVFNLLDECYTVDCSEASESATITVQ